MIYLLIFLAGGAGATLRFTIDSLIKTRWSGSMPLATFFINASGSFLLGALTGFLSTLASETFVITENISLVVSGGFLGGYTTFSTAMIEAAGAEATWQRTFLTLGQALTCLACAGLGMALFR